MANSNTSSRYLSVASGHIDSLIDYVLDVKPYHTKLSEIVEEFLFEDHISVKINEHHEQLVVLGPDFLNKSANSSLKVWDKIGASRPLETLSAERTVISDGTRRTFPVPMTAIPKLLSHSSQEQFVIGENDDQQIPGLSRGVYSGRRFEGPGIPRVLKNGAAMIEGMDYHVSYGAFSFKTFANSQWKEATIDGLSSFARNPGGLAFNNVYERFGSIVNISTTYYEEFTLTWSASLQALRVVGSQSGFLGTVKFNHIFNSGIITFKFVEAYGDDVGVQPLLQDGDQFVLTPREKITVSPTAPAETWTLIKTNPQALSNKPVFSRTSAVAVDSTPSLSIFTQSLEWTPQSNWTIQFTSPNVYTISATGISGYPKTVDLINGCTYQDEYIHFTVIPPLNGFQAGDKFQFSVSDDKPNYLVYGSVSGWQAPATIGKWYWNGKVGFKIPKLDYFAIKHSATISVSSDASTWTPVVVNKQEMTNISYINNAFIASGARAIVAQSSNGLDWTSDLTNFVTVGNKLIVIGEDGLIAQTDDGKTWYRVASHTSRRLRGIDVIPTDNADEAATPNLIIVVGDNGSILTSLNGLGWTSRNSGTNYALYSVTHSPDWIVAVGDNGTIIRSQDRINWITCVSPTNEQLNKVKYLNSQFWAVGKNGTIIKSSDGVNWTSAISNTSAELNDIAYGNEMLVAVGHGGVTCKSFDGLFWNVEFGKPLNAIEYGEEEQVFVSVEHKVNEVANFIPLRAPHSVAQPSVYSLVFRAPMNGDTVVGGTVQHNVHGFRKGFKTNQDWSDEFVSFKIGPSTDVYRAGEQIDVYLVPKASFVAFGEYDDLPYDSTSYDSKVGKLDYPLDLMQEYFPLHHSIGSVIFPTVTAAEDGHSIIIDKAASDSIHFRIGKGSEDQVVPPAELAAINGWIPLEYRYYDRRISNDSAAEFPDLATYIDAYLASDPDTKVFTITQPRYKTTNRPSTASLTFEDSFFTKYLPERKYFSFRFNQADSYGQTLNVKVTENLRIYARVRLDFDEIAFVKITDATPQNWHTVSILNEKDSLNVNFTEGGLFSRIGFADLPYDTISYDVSFYTLPIVGVKSENGEYVYTGNSSDFVVASTLVDEPAITVKEKDGEVAGTAFVEGLQIVVRHTAAAQVGYESYPYDTMPYDYTDDTPINEVISMSVLYDVNVPGGVRVNTQADEYIVTHNFVGSTPTVLISPDAGPVFTVQPEMIYTPVAGAQVSSFKIKLPQNVGPFQLTLS